MAFRDPAEAARLQARQEQLGREHPACPVCGTRHYHGDPEQWINVGTGHARHRDIQDCIHALGRALDRLSHMPPEVC